MKAEELRSKSEDELNEELLSLRKERFNFRFQKSSGQLENTARVREVRRDIARIKTVLQEVKTGNVPTASAKPAKKAKPAKAEKAEKAEKPAKAKKAAPKKKEVKE